MRVKIKVLIVDDQTLVRQGLATLLALEEDLEIVGQAGDGEEAISQVGFLQPDVVLMDMRMPKKTGVEATQEICKRYPSVKVLVLTTYDEDDLIVGALKAGACGYLLKDSPSEKLAIAIRAVKEGYTQLSPAVTPKVVSLMHGSEKSKKADLLKSFSEREVEIIELIAKGLSNKEIAETLYITQGTVKNYVTKILGQLNLRDRTQLAVWVKDNM
ncbi:response regulator transcription factor [Candidatus Obscuribacterales bacterium]|nr:response regulator transcription factor [Candidatus Obscuribacterales bacterium]MBX3151107.1 response regulator transcription factor [Candidatus Obscuribacterales bacterium]